MLYRRILFLGQFAAALIFPAWVLISRGILDDGIGWQFVVYLFVCPLLSVTMLAVAGLTTARASVRTARRVSWLDAALLTAWYVSIFAYGFWAWTIFAVLVVLLGIGAFWAALYQFFTETRARLRGMVAGFEEAAQPGATSGNPTSLPRVIVINPDDPPKDR